MEENKRPVFLSPQELAEFLGVPLSTIYGLRYQGKGPRGHRIGEHVRFRREDVEAWLAARADPSERGQ